MKTTNKIKIGIDIDNTLINLSEHVLSYGHNFESNVLNSQTKACEPQLYKPKCYPCAQFSATAV